MNGNDNLRKRRTLFFT